MAKIKKRYLIFGGIAVILFLFLFFLSSLIKAYLVENSNELIGRKLSIDKLHINYLKVQVTIRDFSLYEENQKDTFVYFKELLVDYNPWKMLSNEYAVGRIRLVEPYIYIQQEGDEFNFDSLIPESDSTVTKQDTLSNDSNIKFSIRNIELIDGKFHYYDNKIDNLLTFSNLNLELPLIAWNSKNSEMGVKFSIGESGLVKVDAEIDQQKEEYNISFGTENIQLNSFTNYLKDYMHISQLNGLLQSNIDIVGSIAKVDSIIVSGLVQVDSLSLIDNKQNELASALMISTMLDSINLGDMRYTINKVFVDQPKISTVLYPEKSNWEWFLDPILSDTISSNSVEDTISNSGSGDIYYRIDTIKVNNGTIIFADNTLNRPFTYSIKNINVELKQLAGNNDSIPMDFYMEFNNEGKFSGKTAFSIQNPLKLFVDAKVSELDLHSFSPYTEYYLGYPIISGAFNYDCTVKMTPNKLRNSNYLLVKEPQFGKKTKDTTAYKLPLKLALYLIKDASDNVSFELPVSGNPSEPGFKLGPLIWKTFGKFIFKTASQPFNSLAKLISTQPEELEHVKFEYTQDSLMNDQRKTLDKIAHILSKKDNLVFTFRQESSLDEEIALLAEKNIKRNYIENKSPVNIQSWKDVKNNDEALMAYLKSTYPEISTIDSKDIFIELSDKENLKSEFNSIYQKRNQLILDYLVTAKHCNPNSIKTLSVDFDNMPQELKRPGFRVEVSIQ